MNYLVTFSYTSWGSDKKLVATNEFTSIDDVIEVLHSIDVATDYNLISVVSVNE